MRTVINVTNRRDNDRIQINIDNNYDQNLLCQMAKSRWHQKKLTMKKT